MTRFDKFYMWTFRIIGFPVAGACAYIVWDVWQRMIQGAEKTDDILLLLFCFFGGAFSFAYFIASWISKPSKGGNND